MRFHGKDRAHAAAVRRVSLARSAIGLRAIRSRRCPMGFGSTWTKRAGASEQPNQGLALTFFSHSNRPGLR